MLQPADIHIDAVAVSQNIVNRVHSKKDIIVNSPPIPPIRLFVASQSSSYCCCHLVKNRCRIPPRLVGFVRQAARSGIGARLDGKPAS